MRNPLSADPSSRLGIAIIGMAGRFPGADTPESFWTNLCAGVESIRRFTDHELDDWQSDEARRAANYVKARPVLDGVDKFDAEFFGMQARETELTDPQHRLFLECAWEALEDGGYDPARYPGTIGVFAGSSLNSYFLNNVCRDRSVIERFTTGYQVDNYAELLGSGSDFLATRVAYKLDLKGPALTLQTACSTSLVAVIQAAQSLLLYQSDMALAGGVSITFPQNRGYLHQEGGMVSADGVCRPFDAGATGTIFGSGAGCVLLKRLADALADGDHIYAVIRGWGLNNDGGAKVGFTAPSPAGQAAAIEMAHAMAGITGDSISYVECHGTATPLGDPIEVAGLTQAFNSAERQFCAIGSVKGNIGHLDAAAGIAGLMKTALSLHHRRLPASLHFQQPNPEIDFAASPFYVNAALADWQADATPRRAGVSAFGIGGTNAHIVVEEAPAVEPATHTGQDAQLLILSASSEAALAAACANLAGHLRKHPEQRLADIAHTLQVGRREFPYRASLVCRETGEAAAALEGRQVLTSRSRRKDPPVVFLFPGQGTQYPEMGRGLYDSEPVFRRHFDACAAFLAPLLGTDLRQLLYAYGDRQAAERQVMATAMAQPALFAVEYATAQQWMAWGVRPAAMIGHSIGEFVAATLAGVLSLEDALRVVVERGRLMQSVPGGAMLAVRLAPAELEAEIAPPLAIAAINSATLCVVAGPYESVDELAGRLTARGVMVRRLHTSHAFHSPMMEPVVAPLTEVLKRLTFSDPQIPYVSSVTGCWIEADQATAPDYWARQVVEPVRFAAALESLPSDRWPVLLEVGPGEALLTLAHQARRGTESVILGSLPDSTRSRPDRDAMLDGLGQLWTHGVSPDWESLREEAATRVPLPTYPFQRRRYWIDPPSRSEAAPAPAPAVVAAEAGPSPAPKIRAPGAAEADNPARAIGTKLVAIFEELSGESIAAAGPDVTFLEMGFDSLFLNQAAQRIQAELKVKIAFRQLLGDYATIPALSAFIARQLPAAKPEPAPLPREIMLAATPPAPPVEAEVSGKPAPAARPSRFDTYRGAQSSGLTELTPAQRRHIDRLAQRYNAKTAGSKRQADAHRPVLADPRAIAGFRSTWKELVYPIVCARSKGARIWDIDGNEYIDLVNGYGQTAFGHAPDFVVAAVQEQLGKGFAIGPQADLTGEVATLVAELTGNERVTFCNTGSEAVMAALRVARAVTGRSKVVIFNGAYHGQFDEVLVRGVPQADGTPRSLVIAAGVSPSATQNVVVLDYASPASLEWIERNAAELAAVVVEPVQSRHPALQPIDFLRGLRRITEAHDIAFVMDEIVTGFRVHPGGMQALTGIQADLATYGKVVGGGLPIGILAGKAKFMDALDGGPWRYGDDSMPEVGTTFFAGTFVRHPLTLAATLAVLKHLKTHGHLLYEQTTARLSDLASRLRQLFARHGLKASIESYSSFLYFDLFQEHPLARLLHHHLRLRGIHIQDGFPCFLTTAHTDADIEAIAAAFDDSLREMEELEIFSPRPVDVSDLSAADDTLHPVRSVPLSESQMEIWLAAQRGDDASCAFNESVLLRLDGELDQPAFESAFSWVVQRHDSLRASFGATGESMRIAARLEPHILFADLSSEDAPEESLTALIDEEARTPFDLADGPVIRARLLRLSPKSHAAIITAHHLICDGWSINIILRDLVAAYGKRLGLPTEALPDPFSFASYIELQRNQTPEDLAKTEAYWLGQFAEPAPRLELPLDRPRSVHKSYAGGTRCRLISAELYRAVKAAGAKQNCTLFVALLTGFEILIGRLGQQEDIVVGIPTAGQSLLENDNLVGQCVHFLPLRTRWNVESRIADLLKLTREKVLGADEYRSYTLGTLVRKLAPEREINRLPLTEVQFNLERLAGKFELPGLQISTAPNPKAYVNYDIFFNVIESDAGLRIDCDYNADLWDASTIDGWLDSYATVLQAIAADAQQPISQVSYLAAAERSRLAALESVASDFPRDLPLQGLFERQVRLRPDAVALSCGEDSLTYAALDRRANVLANHIRGRGVPPGGLIGILIKRSPEMLIALLAVLKAGNAYVPLDPAHPPIRLRQILGDAGISALLVDDTPTAEIVPGDVGVIQVSSGENGIDDTAGAAPDVDIDSGDLAYVIYTSGSTGTPKGVEVTHRSVVNAFTHLAREPGLQAGDKLLAVTTISFDIAAVELLLPLCVGATVVIARREEIVDGFRLMERLSAEKVTAMQATPSTWRLLLEAGFEAPPGFKMLCGGEALPLDLAERLLQSQGELWNMYGPTEATIWASCQRITRTDQPISVGRPMANTRFCILDRYGQQVPIGKEGELYIGGEGVARGYHNRPDLTAERFLANPFGEGRLYRTGDLARHLPGGEVQILGRIDQQIKLRGFRIEPGEIEHALTRHLGLAAAVVALRQDAPSGPQLVAYYVEHQDRNESSGVLRSRLGQFLPDYMIPTAWMRLDRLPLLPNGKLDRASLPRPEAVVPVRGDDDKVPVPQSAAEITLAKIWAEVLGLERVSAEDDVLDLGADSIQIFKITARANREGLRFTAKQLMKHRTVRAVAHAAEQAGDAAVIDVSTFRPPLRPAPVTYALSAARAGRDPAVLP